LNEPYPAPSSNIRKPTRYSQADVLTDAVPESLYPTLCSEKGKVTPNLKRFDE
jgi:hypothetical protein